MPSMDITHFDLHQDNCTLSIFTDHPDHPEVCCGADGGGGLVVLGIVIGLGSSVLINVGQNIQAIGAKEPGADVKPCTSRKWVMGLSLFITGSIGNMVAMAFAVNASLRGRSPAAPRPAASAIAPA